MEQNGMFIVFEGVDGSGKTTIINSLPQYISKKYSERDILYYHWRPCYLKSPNKNSNENTGKACIDPHGKPPYNKLVSIGKFLYFNLDYILGYYFKVKKEVQNGKLVIFDRYYYDYYIDKYRYRLNISDFWLDLCMPLIPRPKFTFLLLGDPIVLYERKKEITIEEIEEQNAILSNNKGKFANAVIIDVSKDIKTVVSQVSSYILQ